MFYHFFITFVPSQSENLSQPRVSTISNCRGIFGFVGNTNHLTLSVQGLYISRKYYSSLVESLPTSKTTAVVATTNKPSNTSCSEAKLSSGSHSEPQASNTPCSGAKLSNARGSLSLGGDSLRLRERFIQRLILDGKKAIATKIFDESLELLKTYIEKYNKSNDAGGRAKLSSSNLGKVPQTLRVPRRLPEPSSQDLNLQSLALLTKEEIFVIALRKAQPWITTSSLRRGGKKVIIPEILTPSQQESIAIRWLILNSRNIAGKSMAECLAGELFGCLTNQGKTINQREQLHKLAEANRAWAS